MTRLHALPVFLIGFGLIAIHRFEESFLDGWALAPLLELMPYLLILVFWSKMKEMALGFLLLLFGFLELNHTRLIHLPELLAQGLGRTTMTPLLFDIGAVLFIVASIMVFQVWYDKKGFSGK